MTARLKNLKIQEVTSCAKGANPLAFVAFAKKDESSSLSSSFDFKDSVLKGIFEDVLSQMEVEDKFWRLKNAMSSALEKIWFDDKLPMEEKKKNIKDVVQSFGDVFDKVLLDASEGILKNEKGVSSMEKDGKEKLSADQIAEKGLLEKAIDEKLAPIVKRVEALNQLTADEFAFMKALSSEKEKDDFLALDSKARAEVLKKEAQKKQDGSEALTVDGVTVTKADVGEGVFAVLKKQQEAIQKAEEKNKKLAEDVSKEVTKRREIELAKKAEEEFNALPGNPIEKGKALGYVEALPQEAKESILQMLKAGNEALAKGMAEFGHGLDSSSDNPENELNKLAIQKAQKDGITYEKAYDAILQTREGQEIYSRRFKKS